MKGWGEKEYQVLKEGTVEEYILNVLGFDLIFLTPADFINFFSGAWNQALPSKSCQKCGEISSLQTHKSVTMKVDFVAHEICKNVVAQLGHAISVKFLPSQVAAACLHLAKK